MHWGMEMATGGRHKYSDSGDTRLQLTFSNDKYCKTVPFGQQQLGAPFTGCHSTIDVKYPNMALSVHLHHHREHNKVHEAFKTVSHFPRCHRGRFNSRRVIN